MNQLKPVEIAWNFFILFSKNLNLFCQYIRMENPNNKNENTEIKYLNNILKNQFLKVKNSLLELEKDLIEFKDSELKDGEVKK